jgi:hypothetical protein
VDRAIHVADEDPATLGGDAGRCRRHQDRLTDGPMMTAPVVPRGLRWSHQRPDGSGRRDHATLELGTCCGFPPPRSRAPLDPRRTPSRCRCADGGHCLGSGSRNWRVRRE